MIGRKGQMGLWTGEDHGAPEAWRFENGCSFRTRNLEMAGEGVCFYSLIEDSSFALYMPFSAPDPLLFDLETSSLYGDEPMLAHVVDAELAFSFPKK
ncbi:MAG: hypothetical protein ACSHYB_12970 [Roseibacillus sp.]